MVLRLLVLLSIATMDNLAFSNAIKRDSAPGFTKNQYAVVVKDVINSEIWELKL